MNGQELTRMNYDRERVKGKRRDNKHNTTTHTQKPHTQKGLLSRKETRSQKAQLGQAGRRTPDKSYVWLAKNPFNPDLTIK
jgi:hypothetical protein